MHSSRAVESDFQPTNHFRIIAGWLGDVLEHVKQCFRANELRLPYPRNDVPRDFLPDRFQIFFLDIGAIHQHVRMQVGVVETDLIDPDSAPAFDSLHQQSERFLYVLVKFLDLFSRKLARVPACQRNSPKAKPPNGVPMDMAKNGGVLCVKAGKPSRGATRAESEIAVHGRQEFVLFMSLTLQNDSFSRTVKVTSGLAR